MTTKSPSRQQSKEQKTTSKAKPRVKGACASLPTSVAKDYTPVCAITVPVKIVADEGFTPEYQTGGSVCVDLAACLPPDHTGQKQLTLPHRSGAVIDAGFSMELPKGYRASITARSGLASKGLMIANAPGIIDSDYRGRVRVSVINVGKEIIVIKHGDRIAQMAIEPVYLFDFECVPQLEATERGEGGFGSTGVN